MTTELWVPPSVRETYKKAPPPKTGEAFGAWAGRDLTYLSLPGGAVLQFDLSKLTLQDFRSMRDHYQINVSLSVLTFMIHQLEWHVECEKAKIRDFIEENLHEVWTRLIRAVSQAYWAGYAPNVLQWENTDNGIELTKVKDLVPEECRVNWKEIKGYAPPLHAKPKMLVYDGIKQAGSAYPIPTDNTFWYPLLMENGDHYGRKLLRPAFPSWFFSILIHLFSNRYFERFGEPVPVGRADFDAMVEVDGNEVSGRQAMMDILTNLRNRSVVVLPSERMPIGTTGKSEYAFDIEYLESQMRGADFERYLFRLDEEMSLSIFTPTLLIRTADVGSYNLGTGHMQMYLWMLNALAGDLKEYLDRYVITRLKDFNFGPNAPKARWVPRKMGKAEGELLRAIVQELIRGGKAKPDLDEIGEHIGLSLTEIKEVVEPPLLPGEDPLDPNAPKADPNAPPGKPAAGDPRSGRQRPKKPPLKVAAAREVGQKIRDRVRAQAWKADRETGLDDTFAPDFGYRRQFEEALVAGGLQPAESSRVAEQFYGRIYRWANAASGTITDPEEFVLLFGQHVTNELDALEG